MCLRFSPDGRDLATGYYFLDEIVVFDLASGKKKMELKGHRNGANTFDYSPDGLRLVSGGHDHTIRFWNTTNGKLLKTHKPRGWDVNTIRFAPDGQSVATGLTDSRVFLWEWTLQDIN